MVAPGNSAGIDEPVCEDHELYRVFAEHGFTLNNTLREMLSEHFTHRTERRGCGFTQATRHLAALVNLPRDTAHTVVARLFPAWTRHAGDATPSALQSARRAISSRLEREESRLLAALICDLVLPSEADDAVEKLPVHFDEIRIGTCPLAEKYFLEIAGRFVRRRGRMNVLVSAAGEPLLLEKMKLGDDHSCISITELFLNGVHVPPGCLVGVQRKDDVAVRENRSLPGSIIPVARCEGFRLLRLTTLAVSPEHRRRAFTTHFQSQVDAGLYAPAETTIAQLRRVAQEQL